MRDSVCMWFFMCSKILSGEFQSFAFDICWFVYFIVHLILFLQYFIDSNLVVSRLYHMQTKRIATHGLLCSFINFFYFLMLLILRFKSMFQKENENALHSQNPWITWPTSTSLHDCEHKKEINVSLHNIDCVVWWNERESQHKRIGCCCLMAM